MSVFQKVSVLIPNYNRENTIARAINSVLAQTYGNWELIIADDGSTDRSIEIIESFTDPRIRLVKRSENGGNAAARNTCLDHATGDYLAWLDSDDAYEPEFLNRSINNPELGGEVGFSWVGTRLVEIEGSTADKPCWKPNPKYWDNPYHFFHELHTGTGKGLVLTRACLEDGLRFDERLRVAVDTDFLLRLRQKWKYTYLDVLLYTNYLQAGSVRTNTSKKMESYGIMLNKYSHIIEEDPSLMQQWYYKYMWLCLQNGAWSEARRAYNHCQNYRKATITYSFYRLFGTRLGTMLHSKISQWT